ncbi:Flavodoxin [Pseudobutyrivibrio sp. ACV-2]|uniref:flavodoxin n=1 Tax=Pseudobutyrivibrio sp. ACV-2 TaxID=1520801 RepID=UPI0008972FC0|nr:flavodoxin [Pseudobutyrivibrio sp. ACV-2]SEA88743.1 Flavodoxin [Pseudobutyrivibrio sp. ACV-2]
MKKIISMLLISVFTVLGLVGCGEGSSNNETVSTTEISDAETSTVTDEVETSDIKDTVDESADEKMLVIYFSATGTTKGIAEKIASVTGADLYEIVPKEPYTDEDLKYSDDSSRATVEQNDPDVRPEYEDIQVDIENDYSTIFIGYPIWWGQEPRIMDTFVESYNFEGKTIIPFCTSGSSGIESSSANLVEKAGTGNWLSGNRFSGSATEDEIKNWISGLELD